jgi:hypothetical protein
VDLSALQKKCGLFQIPEPPVGAGTDENLLDGLVIAFGGGFYVCR